MFVSVMMVRILLDECRARGVPPELLLHDSGLTEDRLADSRQRVPSELFGDLSRRAMDLTGDPGLGLALGARLPDQALQVVGFLLASAPTLRQAYADFQRFASLLAETPSWQMREDGTRAHYEFMMPIVRLDIRRMANDWALALAHRIITACGDEGERRDVEIGVGHARPANAAEYASTFHCPVRFGQPHNVLSFPRRWLDRKRPLGDATTSDGLRDMAERLLASVRGEVRLTDRLRVMLRREPQLVLEGVAALARRNALSESALRRSLAAEGTSPSQLVDEARCRVACAELENGLLSVKQLASSLGYTESSSFHRAFKRWTGQTPLDYRAALEQRGA